jgi:hypothetical protein
MEPWPLFSETDQDGNFRSLVWDRKHLIIKAFSSQPRLFDWHSDPIEQVNLAASHPEVVRKLRAMMPHPPESIRHPDYPLERLKDIVGRSGMGWENAALETPARDKRQMQIGEMTLDADEAAKLQALGYLGE